LLRIAGRAIAALSCCTSAETLPEAIAMSSSGLQFSAREASDCLERLPKLLGDFIGSPYPDSKLQIHVRLGWLHPALRFNWGLQLGAELPLTAESSDIVG
jgi:hypothetical protein